MIIIITFIIQLIVNTILLLDATVVFTTSIMYSVVNWYFTSIARFILECFRNIHLIFYASRQAIREGRWAYWPSEMTEIKNICCTRDIFIGIDELLYLLYIIHAIIIPLIVFYMLPTITSKLFEVTVDYKKTQNKYEKHD
jgi:hypothetical protein